MPRRWMSEVLRRRAYKQAGRSRKHLQSSALDQARRQAEHECLPFGARQSGPGSCHLPKWEEKRQHVWALDVKATSLLTSFSFLASV